MKTKKIKHPVFLTAFLAIFLAVISIVTVNKIMARESTSVARSSNSYSKEKAGEEEDREERKTEKEKEKKEREKEVEKELKPEVKIKIEETKKKEKESEKEEEKEAEKRDKEEEKEIKKRDKEEEKESEEENEESTKKFSGESYNNKNENNSTTSEIKSEVEGAEEVEYNLVKRGSVEPNIYLGKAEKSDSENENEDENENENSEKDNSDNSNNNGVGNSVNNSEEWSMKYDFSNVPAGEYDLYAEVRNQYGTYSSDRVPVKVERDLSENMENRVQLGQEGITIKVSNIKKNNAGEKIKKLNEQQKVIESDSSLTEEEKQTKLKEVEDDKKKVISEFNFRNQLEEIYKKKDEKDLTEEDKKSLEETKEILKVDSDGDGLPDHEELRIGSDPFSADSDQDGYLDGDEVANGYNPLKTSTEEGADKIVFEEPKDKGEENNLYEIEKVEMKNIKDEKGNEKKQVALEGRALPNSFVTLYIYSDPVVVTVKTDEDGNWSYILDKELEDGEHEVYSAVTDNTGKITSKSKAFAFVKTAQAVTPKNQVETTQALSPIEKSRDYLIFFVLAMSAVSLVVASVSIILLFKNHKDNLSN